MTSGGIVAVVPIRSVTGGKTRLAAAVAPRMREELVRRMLLGVLTAIHESHAISAVAVVSPDREALALAASAGAVPVAQAASTPGLNAAIDVGRQWAKERGAGAMLVLFGDLPLLTGDDVRNLVRRDAPVVLAPDRHGSGTNALLLRLGDAEEGRHFRFHYGHESYAHHIDEAHRLGLEVTTSIAPGTTLDLDTPDDLRLLGWVTAGDVPIATSEVEVA
ncbi:MAG: 2-phospho-L-lactate guanylyltransferase [Thermomicrobiales bacterium]